MSKSLTSASGCGCQNLVCLKNLISSQFIVCHSSKHSSSRPLREWQWKIVYSKSTEYLISTIFGTSIAVFGAYNLLRSQTLHLVQDSTSSLALNRIWPLIRASRLSSVPSSHHLSEADIKFAIHHRHMSTAMEWQLPLQLYVFEWYTPTYFSKGRDFTSRHVTRTSSVLEIHSMILAIPLTNCKICILFVPYFEWLLVGNIRVEDGYQHLKIFQRGIISMQVNH